MRRLPEIAQIIAMQECLEVPIQHDLQNPNNLPLRANLKTAAAPLTPRPCAAAVTTATAATTATTTTATATANTTATTARLCLRLPL